jgi:hypothetical protein
MVVLFYARQFLATAAMDGGKKAVEFLAQDDLKERPITHNLIPQPSPALIHETELVAIIRDSRRHFFRGNAKFQSDGAFAIIVRWQATRRRPTGHRIRDERKRETSHG